MDYAIIGSGNLLFQNCCLNTTQIVKEILIKKAR